MINKIRRSGGWQANIEYFDGYVIKTPKSEDEIRNKIRIHYEKIGKLDQLETKVKKLQEDWERSVEIVKSGKIPLKMLAYPEFLEGGKIKQKKVKMLDEVFEELVDKNNVNEAYDLVDKVMKFIIELWKYGVHEITFKFYSEMGLIDGEIVLIDIGELTDDKEFVKKSIQKDRKVLEDLRRFYHDDVLDYYQDQVKKKLTLDVLENNWGKNL